ncbi:MAG: sugar phosphate isomerase/epimerase [Lentisphaerota bacterium]
MKKNQIAAQLFTLRDFLKTPEDIAASLKKVKQIGYDAVQVSGMGPIAEEELVKILDGEGLICCATHEPGGKIVNETAAVIERLNKLNCKYTAYPFPHKVPASETEAVGIAQQLENAAVAMAAAGQVLTYHNHATEFTKFGGRTMLDIFYDEAPHLQGELDTFWVQHGGGNPVSWIRKLSGRLPLLHLKEFGILDSKITMYHIGGGNLEWDAIIPAAEIAGVEWFIVEQDNCLIDPFESLKLSFEYLVSNHADKS